MKVIADLCDQYPEGVGTAQLTPKLQTVPAQSDERIERLEARVLELFPIELFEKGRAGIEAEKAAHIQKRHVANPKNAALTNTTLTSIGINMSDLAEEIRDFEERSDLLFAYYPEATPSYFKGKVIGENPSGSKDVHRVRRRPLYRKELKRLQRIESLIKSEAISANTLDFDTTAKLVWIWMIQQVNLDGASDRGLYQGCMGRIITGLPEAALKKLSFIASNGRKVHERLTNQIGLEHISCSINGKSIQAHAKDRETSTTMEEMMKQDTELSRWQFIFLEYLGHHDGLSFSLVSRKALAIGICLLSAIPLPETGRTWNFSSLDETNVQDQTKFWQHVDFGLILPECTHTIIISYYLEISESWGLDNQRETAQHPLENGGLVVVSDHSKGNTKQKSYSDGIFTEKVSWDIVAHQQKKAIHSLISTPHGFEVHLSFKYNPMRSYNLRAHGPRNGGRVSVSNTKIRQVCM
jgi:hypothetical protein